MGGAIAQLHSCRAGDGEAVAGGRTEGVVEAADAVWQLFDGRGLLVAGSITLTQTIAAILIPTALGMILYLARRNAHSALLKDGLTR